MRWGVQAEAELKSSSVIADTVSSLSGVEGAGPYSHNSIFPIRLP